MNQETRPTKEQVRHYIASRLTQKSPPPSMAEIRRQLGWGLLAPRLTAPAGANVRAYEVD